MSDYIQRQELWCHGCDNYVQFDIDLSLNGNHEFACPVCGHKHYRYVENGRITSTRWQSSGPIIYVNANSITYSTLATSGTACGNYFYTTDSTTAAS